MAAEAGREDAVHRARKPVGEQLNGSFNGKLRDEFLNMHWFTSLREVQIMLEEWRQDYNQVRPHSTLD